MQLAARQINSDENSFTLNLGNLFHMIALNGDFPAGFKLATQYK